MSRGLYDKVNKVCIPTAGSELPSVDSSLSTTSTNPVQNKVIALQLQDILNSVGKKLSTQYLYYGATQLFFEDESITTDSTIEVYSSVWGVNPTEILVINGMVRLTFKASESEEPVGVYIIVK